MGAADIEGFLTHQRNLLPCPNYLPPLPLHPTGTLQMPCVYHAEVAHIQTLEEICFYSAEKHLSWDLVPKIGTGNSKHCE